MNSMEIVEKAMIVRPLTEINERECVARWAMKTPANGLIVEVGCLYGGMTAILALAAPTCQVITMDNFSWHPEDDVPTSPELLYKNMMRVGIKNVEVMEGDSRVLGQGWKRDIDFCWIDGGHSYDWVLADLMLLGTHSPVIALHDYGNPFWTTIEQAVTDFMRYTAGTYEIVEIAGTVVILKRK